MDVGSWIVLTTGVLAALVAVVGYLMNQFATRNERRSRVYAEALSAVFEYQELPYHIRKRTADPSSACAIGQKISDIFERLSFYQTWMLLESPTVGDAYLALVRRTQAEGGPHRAHAWQADPAESGGDFHFADPVYPYDNEPERKLCILAMQREMAPLTILRRWSTGKLVAAQIALRAAEAKHRSTSAREDPEEPTTGPGSYRNYPDDRSSLPPP
jgi:hypothetical protein